MMKTLGIFLFVFTISHSTQAAEAPWASVTILRGSAAIKSEGSASQSLSLGQKISEGATIKTEARSFVRLSFADQSILNIAPSSQIQLKMPSSTEPALWNIAKGSIRALIKKSESASEDKVIIRAGNAAIGIRGTDFVVSYDNTTNKTSLLTIQGKVAMANISSGMSAQDALRSGNAVFVTSGQASQVSSAASRPSVPQQMPANQVQSLQRNSAAVPGLTQDKGGSGSMMIGPPQAQGGGNGNGGGPSGPNGPSGAGGQLPPPPSGSQNGGSTGGMGGAPGSNSNGSGGGAAYQMAPTQGSSVGSIGGSSGSSGPVGGMPPPAPSTVVSPVGAPANGGSGSPGGPSGNGGPSVGGSNIGNVTGGVSNTPNSGGTKPPPKPKPKQ